MIEEINVAKAISIIDAYAGTDKRVRGNKAQISTGCTILPNVSTR